MFPVEGLKHEWYTFRTTTAKDDGINGDTLRIFPLGVDDRALGGGATEARVGMGGFSLVTYTPLVTEPGGDWLLTVNFLLHPFPEDTAIGSHANICEDGILHAGVHGNGVCFAVGPRGDTKEASLWVDSTETAILVKPHPGNVIAQALDSPPWERGCQHSQVRLATGAREGSSNELLLTFGIGNAENKHMLCKPTLILGDPAGNTQGKALLAEQGVAAITTTIGHDLALIGEVGDDDSFGIAGPVIDNLPCKHTNGKNIY